ncbi:hypothetical protein Scep_006448 [Stephania cephalantha]|uniref:Molybdenum cofactor sulfurase n=1 Tax=Stephania cephalantha TaxID=152367 RepID=A0AAP0K829_9MAGN
MHSPCMGEDADHEDCFRGCCATPFISLPQSSQPNKSNTARLEFAAATASSLLPNTQFTDHESLPSYADSFSHFTGAYPQYVKTDQADRIREHEYQHLSDHVCLDYMGLGLFSHSQQHAQNLSSSSAAPHPMNLEFPFFEICYKSASLQSRVLYGGQESELECSIRKRIMSFLNISEIDYSMVFTANRTSAFKLVAESYPYKSNGKLLTVYDYESEAVESMVSSSRKRGAKAMSAEFSWPSMRIHSAKLTNMVVSTRKKRKRGLFVFPLQSRMTGARYPYMWMNVAQENGWHVLLDACALGPKEMDTLGLSLFRPDFLICSFFKIFGENPSGFGCLFVKKSNASLLECSTIARSIGFVNLVPAKRAMRSGTEPEMIQQKIKLASHDSDLPEGSSFSGPLSSRASSEMGERSPSISRSRTFGVARQEEEPLSSEIVELENPKTSTSTETNIMEPEKTHAMECRGLDHADSMGLVNISYRARCQINWLVRLERGAAVAFNIFDWKGEKVEPVLVQKLADRSNISLSYGFLHNICFPDKYEEDKERVLETRISSEATEQRGAKKKEKVQLGINVVTAALGFLSNFEDTYRLWAFVAQFLDADFLEKERWRYVALNQRIVEV